MLKNLFIIMTCVLFVQCTSNDEYSKDGFYLDYDEIELTVGETQSLKAYLGTSVSQSHVWYSDNDKVASVDSNGLVEAKSSGTAYITAEILEDGSRTSCLVTVNPKPVEAPQSLTIGGGIEIKKAPFQLGFLKVLTSSTGRWYTNKDYGWTCTATFTYTRKSNTYATLSSTATQSTTGRKWTIYVELEFTDSESGIATYSAYAPSGDTESGTTDFIIYDYYATRQ